METMLETVNPAAGEIIQRYQTISLPAAIKMVDAVEQAFQSWRELPLAQRCNLARQLAPLLRERKQAYAVLMAKEMGKPLAQGIAENVRCFVYIMRNSQEIIWLHASFNRISRKAMFYTSR